MGGHWGGFQLIDLSLFFGEHGIKPFNLRIQMLVVRMPILSFSQLQLILFSLCSQPTNSLIQCINLANQPCIFSSE